MTAKLPDGTTLSRGERLYNSIYINGKEKYLHGDGEGLGAWLLDPIEGRFSLRETGDELIERLARDGERVHPGTIIYAVMMSEKVTIRIS